MAECRKAYVDWIKHQFNRNKHDNQVAPGKKAKDTYAEYDSAKNNVPA